MCVIWIEMYEQAVGEKEEEINRFWKNWNFLFNLLWIIIK